MTETHINAHKDRVAELRQQAAALNQEADELQVHIDSLEPKEVSQPVETPTESPEKSLSNMNRSELNAKAIAVGVESPEALKTNKDVIEAIKAKEGQA